MINKENPLGNPIDNEKLAIENFNALKKFLKNFDSIKLISHLSLTYLYYPGGEFKPDYDDTHTWALWIEFLVGLMTRDKIIQEDSFIHGPVLNDLEKLIKDYFESIDKYIMSSLFEKEASRQNQLLFHLKIIALHVRGDSYPHKLQDLSTSLYTHLSKIFFEKYGFSIIDAIELSTCIKNEYEKRVNEAVSEARNITPIITEKQISENQELEKDRSKLEVSNFCHAVFGRSNDILSFSINDIEKITKIPKERCTNFFNRLSQNFKYSNPHHLNTFHDALKAPFDFNTIYEKPIIKYGNKYIIPVPSLFETVFLNTFHYDFISDENYKSTYDELKGKWLEVRTAEALAQVFGESNVIINPLYPNGQELSDALILFDRKIFIIQCKSKSLTYISKIGIDFKKLKDDLDKGIKSPFEQGLKAKRYLLENDRPTIIHKNIKTTIDTKQVSDVFLFSITLGYYQSLVTRQSNIDSALNYFKENIYPWSLSISDLELIIEIINNPFEFVHYTKRRLEIELTDYDVSADEMDLLNFYITQSMNWENKDFKRSTNVFLTGLSVDIDKYFYEKYELKKDVEKPKRKFADGFKELITQIEDLNIAYKTDCIDKLLLLNKKEQEDFLGSIKKLKGQGFKKGKVKVVNMLNPNYDFGITYFLMDSSGSTETLYNQTFTYSVLRKYEHKKKSWVGLAKDIKSNKLIDLSIFVSYVWEKDSGLEKMINISR